MFDKVEFVFKGGGETGYAHHARSFWGELQKLVPQKEEGSRCTIVLGTVNDPVFYQWYDGVKIAYNVWESSEYPEEFFRQLLTFDQLWVPSTWQRDCAVKQGYPKHRVKVVPEGVDGDTFKPVRWDRKKVKLPFNYMIFGRWEDRKSTTEMIEMWREVMKGKTDVRLLLSVDNAYPVDRFKSTQERLDALIGKDDRIVNLGFVPRNEYVRLMQEGHVFLSCSRAEGWNLPLMEAIACGTVAIYSYCTAQVDFAKGTAAIPVRADKFKKPSRVYGMKDCPGVWAEPDWVNLMYASKGRIQ